MRIWIIIGLVALGGLYFWKGNSMVKQEEITEVRLIPREELFGNPDRLHARLSPDGRYLAYLDPFKNVLNVWVQDLKEDTPPEPYTFDEGRGIRVFHWAFQEGTLIYKQDEDGDENWRLYQLDLATRKHTFNAWQKSHGDGGQIAPLKAPYHVDCPNDRNPEYFDLWEINLKTGDKKRVLKTINLLI